MARFISLAFNPGSHQNYFVLSGFGDGIILEVDWSMQLFSIYPVLFSSYQLLCDSL